MNKNEAYSNLVLERKHCTICEGLSNPAHVENGKWDSNQIGPWSLWQSNLDAEVMVIGQDWGDISYFKKWKGKDQPSGNPTNTNLQQLLKEIGIEINQPLENQKQVIFITNIILCLKTGGLQSFVKNDWFTNCSKKFLKPLIEIINPKVIITLGKKVSEAIFALYRIPYSKNNKFSETIKLSPFAISKDIAFYPMYHCGAMSVNRNRSLAEQVKDWRRVSIWEEGKEKQDNNNSIETRIDNSINIHASASSFVNRSIYEGVGSGDPFPRLHRAAINQIDANSSAVWSRYGIWATTVKDYIIEASELVKRDPEKAIKLLQIASNNLSAFSEIQAEFDLLKNNKE